jgi:hypothetical protein
MSLSRRRAAILAADVVGYSRLIGADEAGPELFDPAFQTPLPMRNDFVLKGPHDGERPSS